MYLLFISIIFLKILSRAYILDLVNYKYFITYPKYEVWNLFVSGICFSTQIMKRNIYLRYIYLELGIFLPKVLDVHFT